MYTRIHVFTYMYLCPHASEIHVHVELLLLVIYSSTQGTIPQCEQPMRQACPMQLMARLHYGTCASTRCALPTEPLRWLCWLSSYPWRYIHICAKKSMKIYKTYVHVGCCVFCVPVGQCPVLLQMQALPTPYMLGRGRSFDEEHRAIGSNVNYQPSHSNHGSGSTPNPQHQRMAQHPFQQEGRAPAAAGGGGVGGGGGGYNIPPENLSSGAHRAGGMGGQHPNYHSQFQDTPYSSLPSSGLGVVGPQHQQRPAYAQDGMYSPADMVDKDSPPSSTIGQGQQPPQSQAGQQRRAHSQMLSMATSTGSGQRYLPAPDRPPMQDQPQLYHNLPLSPGRAPNTVPPNSSGGGRQLQRFGGSERRVGGHPNPQPGARRLPHTQDVISSMGSKQYSTSIEESRRHPTHKPHNPPLEGYVKPQQASPHPRSGHFLAVDPLAGRPENRSTHTGNSAGRPKQGSVSPSQSSGDISKDIDTVIEQTASKMRADELVSEGEGEGIPYDPNLVCPKCRMRFREGEIQKFRRHVSSAHK